MSTWKRIRLALSMKVHRALDQAEDPRETLDYAWSQQHELLRKVKRGLVEVTTSRRLLEGQAQRHREQAPRLAEQAERALTAGREDLARLALARRHAAGVELADLERQVAEIGEEERSLAVAANRLAIGVEGFRTRRIVLAARYTAAEAQVHVRESLAGLSDDIAQLWQALERAEDRTQQMQARAAAIDALIGGGALALPGPGGEHVERELRALEAGAVVDEELRRLKARIEEGTR